MSHFALAAALVLAGTPAHKPVKVTTVAAAWKALPTSGSACGADLSSDYGVEGGMRNFFCRALTVFSWKTFLGLAQVSPFLSGPHKSGKLDLAAKSEFGHYNPDFVRWATRTLVPAADDAGAARADANGLRPAGAHAGPRLLQDLAGDLG